jgi:hypothetical protein
MNFLPVPSPQTAPLTALEQDVLDTYLEWCDVATAAADAFRGWCAAPLDLRARRCSEYFAALAMEELAAEAYDHALQRLRRRRVAGGLM